VLRGLLPEADEAEVQALVRVADGSPGRALRFAGLDVAGLDAALTRVLASGDPDNTERLALARALSGKTAQGRYEAFLDRAPALIARTARDRHGEALRLAIDTHAEARDLAGAAVGLSLDAQATVFEMAGLVARLASR
jgi:DNA polymerase III subunit delta'